MNQHIKCAILTLLYKNYNYGGILQAFALSHFINKNGIDAVQILFDGNLTQKSFSAKLKSVIKKSPVKTLIILKNIIYCKFYNCARIVYERIFAKNYVEATRQRVVGFDEFCKTKIPHTDIVYGRESISECNAQYDAFITGSDQVWNLDWYNTAYFLDFAKSNKIKISYAASSAKNSFTDEQKAIFKKSLKDYNAVSVREENMVDMLKDLSPVLPQLVVDPVLLLDSDDWNKISSDRKCEEPYILCYFLGKNKASRRLVKAFAKKNSLKIACISMTNDKATRNLGDYDVSNASPEDFISLIKNAEYVFTDSFHACVFSIIHRKDFFVFNRSRKGEMSSRITSLLDMFEMPERFCNTPDKESLSYIEDIGKVCYEKEFERYIIARQESENFLFQNLKE